MPILVYQITAILIEAYQNLSFSATNLQQRKRKMGAKKIANVSRETFFAVGVGHGGMQEANMRMHCGSCYNWDDKLRF